MSTAYSRWTALFCLICVLPVPAGFADIPSADIQSGAFIRDWLLCGPFPNPLAEGVTQYFHDETTLGYAIDYLEPLGGEANVQPQEEASFVARDGKKFVWTKLASETDEINLKKIYDVNEGVLAYAACELVSDSDRDVLLGIGSNDGIKIWLNGECVWDHQVARGAHADDDWVRIRVKKGKNLLLLKVVQGLGAWGFYCRTLDLVEKQKILQEGIHESSVEIEVLKAGQNLKVSLGRASRFLILDSVPQCSFSICKMTGAESVVLQNVQAPLGDIVTISTQELADGPHKVEAQVHLPDGRDVSEAAFYYHGRSSVTVRAYMRDGRPIDYDQSVLMQLIDSEGNVVEDGLRLEKPGVLSVLRTDFPSFSICGPLEIHSLGRHLVTADNEGRGYVVPKSGKLAIDFPVEVLKSLKAKAEQRLKQQADLKPWLLRQTKQRLADAQPIGSKSGPAAVYDAIRVLTSLKSKIASTDSLQVWYAPSVEKVSVREPVPQIETDAVRVALARNEYEPFQVVLYPEKNLGKLQVGFSPFVSDSGAELAGSSFELQSVDYVCIEKTTDAFGTFGMWPDALPLSNGTFYPQAGSNTPVWVTVHAPKDQPAGLYSGKMIIRQSDSVVAEIPIEVEVYDFTLPDETGTETAVGVSVNRQYHGIATNEQYAQVHDQYMQFCAKRRITPYSPHAGAGIEIKIEGDPAHAQVGFEKFDKAMQRYLDQFHFTSFNMGGLPGKLGEHGRYTDEYNRLFAEIYGQVQEHLREKGWLEKAYWYWVDEPPKADYPNVKRGMELLKASCPDIRRLLTCNQEDAPISYFFSSVNLWVPIMDKYNYKRAHDRQALGETIWWYVCTGPKAPYPNNFIDNPAMNHRIRFWMIDANDLDGSLYWSVTWWHQNPWEQAMSVNYEGGNWGNGDGRLLYPPRRAMPDAPVIEGPVTTIRFENLRDGIEDREYLLALRKLIEKGNAESSTAQKLLDDVHHRIVPALTYYEQNPIELLVARHSVAEALENKN